ncbi:MAG: hypothetical protein ACREMK_00795 [Gemmatimonadota bacterium]
MKARRHFAASLTAALLVSLSPAAGAQNPWDVTPTGIGVIEKGSNVLMGEVVGSPSAPTFDEGTEIQITCFYKYLAGAKSTPPTWFVDILVDGKQVARLTAYNHEWKTSSKSGIDISKGGLYSSSSFQIVDKAYPAIATWKAVGGGAHTMRCVLDPDHRLPEKNEANNLTEKKIQVKANMPLNAMKNALDQASGGRGSSATRASIADQPAGQAIAKPRVNLLSGANTKSCRTSLSATVALNPSELSSPGFQPAPDGVPQAKLTLYLEDSSAKGNYVHCDYASNKGDVKLSTTLQCKEASPTPGVPHGYRCSP